MPRSRLSTRAALTALLLVLDIATSSCTTSGRSAKHWTAASKELAEVIRTQEIGVWEALKNKDKAALMTDLPIVCTLSAEGLRARKLGHRRAAAQP